MFICQDTLFLERIRFGSIFLTYMKSGFTPARDNASPGAAGEAAWPTWRHERSMFLYDTAKAT